MDTRPFSIVFGYLPGIDDAYKPALQQKLNKRFAIVLNSYRPSRSELYYDGELFFELLKNIVSVIAHDQIAVHYGGREEYFSSLDGLDAQQVVMPGEERDYFDRMDFFRNGTPVCIVNPEPYYAAGGPQPYHDSYTFAFYLADYDQYRIAAAARQVAEKEGYCLENIFTGNTEPEISLLTRLKKML